MDDKKVTKMEHVDNRPRITLEEAAQRIKKAVGRLEFLMETGFSSNADESKGKRWLDLERRAVAEKITSPDAIRAGQLGLAEFVIGEVAHEVGQVYIYLLPEEAMGHCSRADVLSKPGYDLPDTRPDIEPYLIMPIQILTALDTLCTSSECILATLSDRAFDGFIALIEDVHDRLCTFLDELEEYLQELAA